MAQKVLDEFEDVNDEFEDVNNEFEDQPGIVGVGRGLKPEEQEYLQSNWIRDLINPINKYLPEQGPAQVAAEKLLPAERTPEELKKMSVEDRLQYAQELNNFREMATSGENVNRFMSAMSFGLTEHVNMLRPRGEMTGLAGEFAGIAVPVGGLFTALGKPLVMAAAQVPTYGKGLQSLARLTGMGASGGVYESAKDLVRTGEIPTIEQVADHAKDWMALDAGFQLLQKTVPFVKKLTDYAQRTKQPKIKALDKITVGLVEKGIEPRQAPPEIVAEAAEADLDARIDNLNKRDIRETAAKEEQMALEFEDVKPLDIRKPATIEEAKRLHGLWEQSGKKHTLEQVYKTNLKVTDEEAKQLAESMEKLIPKKKTVAPELQPKPKEPKLPHGVPEEKTPSVVEEKFFDLEGEKTRAAKVPTKAIGAKPDLMQFKGMSDEVTGENINDTLKGKWDELKSGILIVWEPKNPAQYDLKPGEKYIVANGHHRLAFAKRQNVPGMMVRIIREADGYTASDALRIGAEVNIAEGKGTIHDQAKYFREDIKARGEAAARVDAERTGKPGEKAWRIASDAGDDLYRAFVQEEIKPEQANAIVEATTDPNRQAIGIKLAREGKSGDQIRNMLEASKAIKVRPDAQLDLFGFDDSSFKAMEDMGRVANRLQKEVSADIQAASGPAKNPERARKLGIDIRKPKQVAEKLDQLRAEKARWENWASHADLVEKVKSEIGEKAEGVAIEAVKPEAKAEQAKVVVAPKKMEVNRADVLRKEMQDLEKQIDAIKGKSKEAQKKKEPLIDELNKKFDELQPLEAEEKIYKDIPKKLYRGYGRERKESAYATSVAEPILGPGKYFAFNKKSALKYGPKIEEKPLDLKDPLIITNEDQWREFTKKAGLENMNPVNRENPDATRADIKKIHKAIKDSGHDGVIIWWKEGYQDQNGYGGWKKNLERIFGEPQVYELPKAEAEVKPVEKAPEQPPPKKPPGKPPIPELIDVEEGELVELPKEEGKAPPREPPAIPPKKGRGLPPPPGAPPAEPPKGYVPTPPNLEGMPSKFIVGRYVQTRPEPLHQKRISLRTFIDESERQLLNKYSPLHKISEGDPSPLNNAGQLAETVRGFTGRVEGIFRGCTYDLQTMAANGPGIQMIFNKRRLKELTGSSKLNREDFDYYLACKTSLERQERGMLNPIPTDPAKQYVMQNKHKFEPLHKDLVRFTNNNVANLRKTGLVSAEGEQEMKELYQDYAPLERLFPKEQTFWETVASRFKEAPAERVLSVNQRLYPTQPLKRAKGSVKTILSPTETILKNTIKTEQAIAKNEAAKAAAKQVQKLFGGEPERISPRDYTVKELQEMIGENFPIDENNRAAISRMANIARPRKADSGKITWWEDGHQYQINAPKEIIQAMEGMTPGQTNVLVKMAASWKNLFSQSVVFEPGTATRIAILDNLVSTLQSKYPSTPLKLLDIPYNFIFQTPRMLFHILNKTPLYQDFLRSGAAQVSLQGLDRAMLESMSDTYFNAAKRKSPLLLETIKTPWKAFKSVFNGIRKVSNTVADAGKMIEFEKSYKAGIKRGLTPREAMAQAGFDAYEVSVPYGREGQSQAIQSKYMIVPFARTIVNSGVSFTKALKDPRNIVAATAYITIPTVAAYLRNREDPRYQAIPQKERDMNIYWYSTKDPNERPFKVRKPWQWGYAFGTLPEHVVEFILQKDPKALKGLLESFEYEFSPFTFLSIGNAFTDHGFDIANMFEGKYVKIPTKQQKLEASLQATGSTSETAKLLGENINTSPLYVDWFINQSAGGLGVDAVRIADEVIYQMGYAEDRRDKKFPETMIFYSTFLGSGPSSHNAHIQKFYELTDKSNRIATTFKEYEKRNEIDKARAYVRKYTGKDLDIKAMDKRAKAYRQEMGKYWKQIELIRGKVSNTNDLKKEKKDELNKIYDRMSRTAQQYNKELETYFK